VEERIMTCDKTLLAGMSVGLMLASCGAGLAQSKSLPTQPKNLDFEAPPAASGWPADWGGGPAGYEPGVDQKVVHGGKQSGRIRSAGVEEGGGPAFGTLVQGFDPGAYRGQRIRYSGYVRSEKAEGGGAALWMRVDGAKSGETLAFDNMHGREITGTRDWTKCEIVLDVPKGAATINFGALLAGKGTAWVDDLQIEKVDSSVPITDLTKQPLPAQPRNLDFESPSAANGWPADWGGGPAGYEPGVDQKIVHGGKQSGCIRFVGTQEAGGPAFGTLVQGFDPEAYRGQRIRYSGYVRAEKAEGGGAALWMRIDGAKPGETLAFDNMHGRALTGTTDWKKCEIVLDVPKEAATISLGALLAGKGTLWVDDLRIEKVDTSVPTTDLTKRTSP
jgi:hypothetical protein